MKNCAIYSSSFDLDKVFDIINSIYKGSKVTVNEDKTKIEISEKKLFSNITNGFNIMTSKTENEEFTKMIEGMYNYFSQIPAKNTKLKEKLLIQISTLNMVIGIVTEKDISDKFFTQILSMTKELGGILFWGSRQLLDSNGKLILDIDGNSEVDDFIVTAHTSLLHSKLKITENGLKRKERSERILSEKDIPFSKTLPVIVGDEDVKIRSIDEIVKRLIALCICALKGECHGIGQSTEETKELITQIIEEYDASSFFSPKENEFLSNYLPTDQEYTEFSWYYEAYLVMLWALGFVDVLGYPGNICDVKAIVRIFKEQENYKGFLTNAMLRNKEDILDEADLIYRYDWACVDARVKNKIAPKDLDAGVVYERHRALNWLINYMDAEWDQVKTDT